jgi:hypothetical protein
MKQTLIPVHCIRCTPCILQPHGNFKCTWNLNCLISVRKSNASPFILCCEFNSVHVDLLIKELVVIIVRFRVFVIILQNL